MHSLLLQTTTDIHWTQSVYKTGNSVLKLLGKHSSEHLELQAIDMIGLQGWAIQPKNRAFALIQQSETPAISAVFFGYLLGQPLDEAITYIENSYQNSGINAVCQLEGIFSCVIFDKRLKKHFIASDHIGHRKLRATHTAKGGLISSHDAAILATSLIPTNIDTQGVLWASSLGWSLGGASFAEKIHNAPPLGYLELGANGLNKRDGQLHSVHQLSSLDNTSDTSELLIKHTKDFTLNAKDIQCDLTCGVDSRAVLGTARAANVSEHSLLVSTVGADTSEDVQIARKITSQYGFKHKVIPTPFQLVSTDEVWDRAKLKAFLSNGDSNFKRALTSIPIALSKKWLTGEGGGIYKGFYFPIAPKKSGFGSDEALAFLLKKVHRSQSFEHNRFGFDTQLTEHINALHQVVPDPYAMLTAFFATDYIGVMGAIVSRFSWFPFKGSPFLSNEAFRSSLLTKPAILKKKATHRQLLRKFMGKTSSVPINGLPGVFTFNHKLRQRFGRFFQKEVVTHETEKRLLLTELLEGELGAFLSESKHSNIWSAPTKPKELLGDKRAFNRTDKLMMACAFQEVVRDLKA